MGKYLRISWLPPILLFVLLFPLLGVGVPRASDSDDVAGDSPLFKHALNVAIHELVSIHTWPFCAISVSIFRISCAAYFSTPPRNPLISLTLRKIAHG